jgi:hypothetical protein
MQVHLFDIDIPGKITFQESKTLTAGQDLTIVDTGLSYYSAVKHTRIKIVLKPQDNPCILKFLLDHVN